MGPSDEAGDDFSVETYSPCTGAQRKGEPMKIAYGLLAALMGLQAAGVVAAEDWLTDFEAAKKRAAERQVPILADFSGSDWCGWCIKLDREVQVTSNTSLNLKSFKSKIEFSETETKRKVVYEFLEHEKNPKDEQDIGMYHMRYSYILKPKRELKKDTRYTVNIAPGVMTKRGNRPTEQKYTSTFQTYPPFRFVNHGFCGNCGYKLTTMPYLDFTNKPEFVSAEKNIFIFPIGEENPLLNYSNCPIYKAYSLGFDDVLLEPNTKYTVDLKAGLTDIYGQKLENPQQISFTTGELTPKMWGPSGYQIITPNIEPKLGIKTVNINFMVNLLHLLLYRECLKIVHLFNTKN